MFNNFYCRPTEKINVKILCYGKDTLCNSLYHANFTALCVSR